MIIYNVTISIDEDIADDWLQWMKEVHIPDVMNTGYFTKNRILRVHAEEKGGKTYSIQYHCETIDRLNEYQEKEAPKLQKDHTERYEGKFAAFRTLLEIVHEG